ncbi:MAG TPA: FGGY-family carbohydrate kinase [Verrucomicrobiae bacterium]|nr:FGGY-family carbohydrate kinase [Verrucomicrobiae bacterium]
MSESLGSGAKPRRVVAIDLGAESCRVSLLNWQPQGATLRIVHRFHNGPHERDGHLYWSISGLREGLLEGLRLAAREAAGPIDSIGVDGWAVDYVRVDGHYLPLQDPFCYRDPRTEKIPAQFWKTLPAERLYTITGVQMLRFNTLYQLIADREAGLPEGTCWLNLPEYILSSLGGRPVSEFTLSTHTQLVNAADRAWSPEVFQAAGLDLSRAPELVAPGSIVGQLKGELAQFPEFRNTQLIAPSCHDTGSAVAGIPHSGDDCAFISSGTWSLVGTVLDRPCLNDAAFKQNISNEGGLEGSSRFLKNVNGMWLIEECMRHWHSQGKNWSVASLIEACRALPAPKEFLDVDHSELLLSGHMPERINSVMKLSGRAPLPDDLEAAPQFANLIFHSLAARYTEVLRMISEVAGKQFRSVYIVGGGNRNTYLNRLLQERSGLEVIRGPIECSTIGNAAIQLAALEERTGSNFGVSRAAVAEWSHRLATLEG